MSRIRLKKVVETWRKLFLPIPIVMAFLLLSVPVAAQEQSEAQKKVLVLYSLREGSPLADISEKVLLRGKMEGLTASIDYYREYIDVVRFPDPEYQSALSDFLKHKYERQRFDLIITVAASALDFVDEYGEELFPGTPVVFISGGNTPVDVLRSKVKCTGVFDTLNLKATLDLALKLQPHIKKVYVVSGASEFDKTYEQALRVQSRGYEGRLEFVYLSNPTLEEIQKTVAELSRESIVYYLIFTEDTSGKKYFAQDSIQRVISAANVPVYIWFGAHLEPGVIGGSLLDYEAMADAALSQASRILSGEKAESIPVIMWDSTKNVVNWPQLVRWGISENRLPPGTTVRFKEPTFWERYRTRIIAVLALVVLQTFLIGFLLAERDRRKRVTADLDERLEFETLLAELSADFAGLSASEVDGGIAKWVKKLGDFLRVDRSAFTEIPSEATGTNKIVDLLAAGKIVNWQSIPDQELSTLASLMPESNKFHVRPKSLLAIPIPVNESARALIFASVKEGKNWPDDLARRLRLAGEIFADAIMRKVAEERLGREKLFADMAIDSLPGIFYHYDENGRFVRWNKNFERVTGYSHEEVSKMHPLDFFADNDRKLIEERISEVFAAGEATAEADLISKDGSASPYFFTGKRFLFEGKPFLIGTGIDIGERTKAEEALQLLTSRLLQLQDDERRRIARELHDVTAQNLGTITINLEGLLQNRFRASDVLKILTESKALGEQSLRELRTLSYVLHPPMLDQAGLVFALEWFIDGFIKRSGIHVGLVAPSDALRLPPDVEIALFRIVQECLINIHRHSGSATAQIRLEKKDGTVILEINDQGRGIRGTVKLTETDEVVSTGVGIPGMKQRLSQLGGRLDISTSDTGTTITAVLPLGAGERNDSHSDSRRS